MPASNRPPDRWEKRGETVVAHTRIFDLRTILYRHPVRQTERDFYVLRAPDWANVIALTPERHLVLVNQFRYGTDNFSLEIPGGVVDKGEDPLETAVRELKEETGFIGRNARVIGSVSPNPAILDNRCHFIFVEGAVLSVELKWDADEEIEVSTAPVDQVYQWARDGRIQHSLVLNALFFFEPLWAALKKN